ncbi:hypothetical protein [Pseudomonas synxantha]|uniref:Prophage PssSM-03 n=1 Tax=Pseudomonas synxantha TaxID=47883 RepID=A0A5D3FZW8_9PSED|nr:hypothetical protein [Pseudomonas synxantha]TYK53891.1 hypothetical protein FXO26_30350 [Pseudomonas synxantha]TYK57276.1 hypothetical protein FXO26_16270 [Pseudomonas synxantha]
MTKKVHGPAFRKVLRPLRECSACRGKGLVSGVFHEMDCSACNASGWVCLETGEALPLTELVLQLNLKVHALRRELAEIDAALVGGAHQQYDQNNRRGAGGTNFTGD